MPSTSSRSTPAPTALLAEQYRLVQDARAVLLTYCATLPAADFAAPVPAFVGKSVRDLLVHVAETYLGWLGAAGGGAPWPELPAGEYADLAAVRQLYAGRVDELMGAFLRRFGAELTVPLTVVPPVAGRAPLELSPLTLFTHVVTHEFHHKGQGLTMTRLLGHQPPDTDVMRSA